MKARRLFSVKDKNGTHRRNKSSEPGHKNHSVDFLKLFKNDAAPKQSADKDEKTKIDEVSRVLAEVDITDVSTDHIREALDNEYAAGDIAKAVDFIQMATRASQGKILPYDPKTQMTGAVNREFVTCYLDALLFAMFARMDAYEPMLQHEFTDEPRKKLATLLRLWVNMLRAGKLIHTDMTKAIQETLAECGWPDAKELEQQDTSEAFAFITETLQLPLLQLQVDLFHQGKRDEDDHKIVQERLLNLAVPPDPEGKGLRLEDCLEEYFNTKVDVLRDSHDEKMEARRPGASRLNTIRLVTREDDPAASDAMLTASPVQVSPTIERHPVTILPNGTPLAVNGEAAKDGEAAGSSRPTARHRSTSVIQHVMVENKQHSKDPDSTASLLERARRTSSTVVKAVTIPAWQFFRLIPWHTTAHTAPQNDQDLAMNFRQKPVVGICLKRYGLNAQNQPMRLNTYIDIPDSLKLPHFMLANDESHVEEDPNGFSTEYKLVLQSVVCHRGDSVYSGHYIAFSRVAPKLLKDNRRHNFDPPPDYEEPQWVKFDDLEYNNRITYVDDLKQALKEEMPYLLFYQIVPMVEVSSTDETDLEPPSYADSKASVTTSTVASLSDSGLLGSTQANDSDYFEARAGTPPKEYSVRFSSDLERPPRLSFDETDDDEARRGRRTPVKTPDTVSPAVTPGEESTRDRLSRAAALFTNKNRSRPPSQAGEGRMSLTMNRLGGLIRTSKEPLRDPNAIAASISAPPPLAPGLASGPPSARQSVDFPRPSFESESRLDLGHPKSEQSTPRKHNHRRIKSKNKGEQPERECSLM
ncbi:ubiquitin C-terminal hydrolase [Plectosphaerella cucumerina]|uniref:ubiquitinyl hydrolase 1 n=1 Tax=Plectosphaerella cucumerina TaxID=40658 RepID=A0A8K0TJ66_9PEZI|nr:ubiquitin C-terminal hydrolase [Plectosphaerella cucumerina]